MTDIAPQPYLYALIQVTKFAILHARVLAWRAAETDISSPDACFRQIADLMDAVHNIPSFINHFPGWDEQFFLLYLQSYDQKWTATDGMSLVAIYQNALQEGQSR